MLPYWIKSVWDFILEHYLALIGGIIILSLICGIFENRSHKYYPPKIRDGKLEWIKYYLDCFKEGGSIVFMLFIWLCLLSFFAPLIYVAIKWWEWTLGIAALVTMLMSLFWLLSFPYQVWRNIRNKPIIYTSKTWKGRFWKRIGMGAIVFILFAVSTLVIAIGEFFMENPELAILMFFGIICLFVFAVISCLKNRGSSSHVIEYDEPKKIPQYELDRQRDIDYELEMQRQETLKPK